MDYSYTFFNFKFDMYRQSKADALPLYKYILSLSLVAGPVRRRKYKLFTLSRFLGKSVFVNKTNTLVKKKDTNSR